MAEKMSELSNDAQRYLDGDRGAVAAPAERAEVAEIERGIRAYAAAVATRVPEARLDDRVMARVRMLPAPRRASGWRWFIAPQNVSVRPVFLALAASLALLVWWPGQPSNTALNQQGTVLVRFELVAPEATSVSLAGSFNGWSQNAIVLVPSSAPGLWTATVPLTLGSHEYMFVVDGRRWIADPTAHAQVDDGFGQTNSVIVVGPRGVVKT